MKGVTKFNIFLGTLSCGRKLELGWADESTLIASTCSSSTPPSHENMQPTPLSLTPELLKETSGLYIEFDCAELKDVTENPKNDLTPNLNQQEPRCSITDALMRKFDHYPKTGTPQFLSLIFCFWVCVWGGNELKVKNSVG